jgi:hypothetical protein
MISLARTRIGTHARNLTAALALLALMPNLAHAAQPTPPPVPTKIQVEDGNVPYLVGYASGTQNYICKSTGTSFAWTLVAPSATLVDDNGKQIMTHYGGPTWQAKDGSKVVGEVKERVDSPTPGAIQWLLLRAKSTSAGPDGEQLVRTTFIQRLNTTGGMAPPTGCDEGHVGATTEVPYTADYYFYRAK